MRNADTLAALRQSLASYELDGGSARTVPLGHASADAILSGGLRLGALHEVYASDVSHGASACGFAAALALRLGGNRCVFWIVTEFASMEFGAPNASGLLDVGVDPERLILLRMSNGEDALRAAGDILSCGGVGCVVIEISGALKALDPTASRRLSLAAAQKSVSPILLRVGAQPEASAAETRWLVHSAMPPPDDWGSPRFDVRLLRNRHGELGNWEMEWDCDSGLFRQPDNHHIAPDYGDLVAATIDGSFAAQERRQEAF
jgi:protein ImuA